MDEHAAEDTANADIGTASRGHLGGGVNQAGGRAYNERLTLSLIRLNGPLPKAELARLTRLSAQTMTMIVRRLEAEGLLEARAPLRGRIGQPSVPYALAANGAYSFGVKIGRRSTEIVMCDFLGEVRDRARWTHAYPVPNDALQTIAEKITAMRDARPPRTRFTGVGIAMPFELWKWADEVDAPPGLLEDWRTLDAAAEITARTGLPSWLANDGTAACGAELARDPASANVDWLYFFIGSFVGGGVVLNGSLYQGRRQNAGAVGSMPVVVDGKSSQLIHHSSLITLEKAMIAAGGDPAILQMPDRDWAPIGPILDRWIERSARALASAIIAGISVIDFQRIVIDGAIPRDILGRIVETTQREAGRLSQDGLSSFDIVSGSIGADARALGGAMLPMIATFACDQDVLLKGETSA